MRDSNQLTKVENCEHFPHVNVTQTLDHITRSAAQKEVLLRILRGEPIDNITGEIDSILTSKKCFWENSAQKSQNLYLFDKRIRRFLQWENRDLDFPDGKDCIVDFFGEEVRVRPDYFVHDGDTTRVVKIKTSRVPSKVEEDIQSYEAYVMGLLGKKLFPDQHIVVDFCHLGDKDSKTERLAMAKPYDEVDKISRMFFDETAEEFFAQKHAQDVENGGGCTEADCAGCAMNNICHFEEPPISTDVMKEVRPISEIRLTHSQQQVIDYEQGIARINAGAGAGKTLVVAMRIVELLKKGYEPEDICLLTFTNAGAEEMTARVTQYCAGNGITVDAGSLTSTTFNAFCQNLLKVYYSELGYTKAPGVLPEETRSGMINRILDKYPRIEEWNYTATSNTGYNSYTQNALNACKQIFAEIKKEGYTLENHPYEGRYGQVSISMIFEMYKEFNAELKHRNLVEYDDQIIQTFELLRIHPSLFEEIGYKHIIVDEFQDTDLPQINLLNQIIDTTSFKSFMAVGDDSQSIFAFRHTSPEYMINFGDYFGRFDDFNLVENHRSAGDIIDVANKINALNVNRVEKDLIATKPSGTGPQINGFYSQKSEYEWVAARIQEEIENGKTPSDIAFLASDKTELTKMASMLTEMGIPSILMNPVPYIANSRVAALTTFYESFADGTTRGLLDYKNALMHGALKGATAQEMEMIIDEFGTELHSGDKTVERFMEYANELDPDKTDECYQSFLEKIENFETTAELNEFFRDFKMYGQDSKFKREGKYEGVCLTTVHSAKGLEWDVTYLSLSKFDNARNHSTSRRFGNRAAEMEETNRKWFVGATRAREKLVMTGQYVLPGKDQNLNTYVKQGYDLMNKPFGYTAGAYWETQAREKQEVKQKAAAAAAISLKSMQSKAERPSELAQQYADVKAKDAPSRRGRKPKAVAETPKEQIEPTQKEIDDFSDGEIEFI